MTLKRRKRLNPAREALSKTARRRVMQPYHTIPPIASKIPPLPTYLKIALQTYRAELCSLPPSDEVKTLQAAVNTLLDGTERGQHG
jgi:hypothetical protein